jgi:HEAT repeat protein
MAVERDEARSADDLDDAGVSMTRFLAEFARLSPLMAWAAAVAALTMAVAVIVERTMLGVQRARTQRLAQRYRPLVQRAIEGDETARRDLLASPARHRLAIGWLLIEPLIEDRDPERIARTRAIADALSVFQLADRYLRSWLWWRRALALRALGLTQARTHTAQLIAALDDSQPGVRAAALDGLADMHDLASLQAIVVRVHDTSLHRGRRGAALKAFGSDCEPFLLELSDVDPANRHNYIQALAICGTARSRPVLCRWTRDPRLEVRATAFEALAYVGLDDESARVAIEGLESDEPEVRAMAAFALRGWKGPGDAAARLAPHLDDTWAVAIRAARTLQSMGSAGAAELQARASRPDLGGLLARQMLWQPGTQH